MYLWKEVRNAVCQNRESLIVSILARIDFSVIFELIVVYIRNRGTSRFNEALLNEIFQENRALFPQSLPDGHQPPQLLGSDIK